MNEGDDATRTLGIVQMVDGNTEKLLSRIDDLPSGAELTVELSKEGKLSVSLDSGEAVTL